MIAMLRRKITAAAICALLLIFAAVVASINVAYRQTLRSQISQSLQILTGDSAQRAARRARFIALPRHRLLRHPAGPGRRRSRMEE